MDNLRGMVIIPVIRDLNHVWEYFDATSVAKLLDSVPLSLTQVCGA